MSAKSSLRVEELIKDLSLEEKLYQLVGLWEGRGGTGEGGDVAPMADAMQAEVDTLEEYAKPHGLGQLTRVFGTTPKDPTEGAKQLVEKQRWLVQNTRHGIPALVHEECLTGLAAWKATTFPAPLSWGSSFHPELVYKVGQAIGQSMWKLGVHQGLAPVLDVVRDSRWGRVEECISEDPYVVGTIATEYVKGIQSEGPVATLKHFVGYSNSRAGRNLAPVHAGPRELQDVLLIPFEMAVLDGGVDSVMNSYAEVDGMPVAADASILTTLLREKWGFTGTVVADYFAIAFLQTLHGVAGSPGDAGAQALFAGIDVELPTGVTYLQPLAEAIRAGKVKEELVDRALRRVLLQKERLGLLAKDYDPAAPLKNLNADGIMDLDPLEHREIARELAEESIVLLSNKGGALPIDPKNACKIAVIGPNAHDTSALFGCYSFANHVLAQHPHLPIGLNMVSVLDSMKREFGSAEINFVKALDAVDATDASKIAEAVEAAKKSEIAVVVVGDRAGLFGRGTSGEGCDAEDLDLPGIQRKLVEAVVASGTPVVLVLLSGRPYAVDWALDICASVIQAFFPGQEGGGALAGVVSGRVNPSGRLPVSLPRSVGAQPYSYLHPKLGGASSVSNIATAPVRPFGFGQSYTTFKHADLVVSTGKTAPTSGSFTAHVTVTNTGSRAGADVVQLYGVDPVASVTRPVQQLLGYARVVLAPGEAKTVAFDVPTTRLAFTDRSGVRVVESGAIELYVGTDCETPVVHAGVELTGEVHKITNESRRYVHVTVSDV